MLAIRRPNDYRALFHRHIQPMYIYEVGTLRVLDVNDAACNLYGYSRTEFLRLTLSELIPSEEDALFREALRQRTTGPAATSLWRHCRADGSVFYVDITSNGLTFEGKAARIVEAVDASRRLAVSRALSDSRAALAEAQALAHLGTFETDFSTGDMRWSPELFRILGVDPARERPRQLHEFDHPADCAAIAAEIDRARLERDVYTIEHRIVTRDGRERCVFERGTARRLIGAVLDITDQKLTQDRLRHLAERDSLTGLANRMLLRERVNAAIEAADAEKRILGVVYIDLDRFKTINDTMAHGTGDEFLRELAARLRRVVGSRGTVARPGGDEFIILIDPLESEAAGVAFANTLLAEIARPLAYESVHLVVTASIGLALFPRDGATPDALLRNADTAMYAAKARSGNAIEVYTPQLHLRALAELELEGELRVALESETLQVAYQPIIEAATGKIVALEALARWTQDGREVEPSDFIPLAEARGLILRLGRFVLGQAAQTARQLLDAGHDLTMCVNISPWQFRDRDFGNEIRRVLEMSGLPAAHLQLEITESAYLGADSDLENIGTIEQLGVRLSIDDFGTGYSSLSYLKRLPVDSLKIDRSFIADIVDDTADQGIVRAMIAVASTLGLSVIAEGVETAAQAEFLRELGCTHFQGFYFARPLLPGPLRALLSQSFPER